MDAATEIDELDTIDEFEREADRLMRTCGQCGPSVVAKMHGILGDGELKWCYHCTNLNREAFNAAGGFLYEIQSV